jgi:hypothetical protein
LAHFYQQKIQEEKAYIDQLREQIRLSPEQAMDRETTKFSNLDLGEF